MSDDRPCMSEEAMKYNKWYYYHRFSLVPVFKTRKPDRYNTRSFSFHWLIFRFWTMDSVDTGLEINFDFENLYIRGRLPYCIFGVFIPVAPLYLAQRYLWRRPKGLTKERGE